PGPRRDRVLDRARPAPLHPPAVGVARRLRQRERLGGPARRGGRALGRPPVAGARGAVRARGTMTDAIHFDQVRLPEAAQALRREVRAFLADEIAAGTFDPRRGVTSVVFDPGFSRRVGARGWIGMTWPRRYGGGERSFLERYVVTEEFRVANAPV